MCRSTNLDGSTPPRTDEVHNDQPYTMISRSRLLAVGGVAFTLLLAMVVVVLSGSAALPFALGNVGSFGVAGASIDTGEPARPGSFTLVPSIDENSSPDGGQLPAGEIRMKQALIDGLVLEKAFELPGGLGTWKLRINAPGRTKVTDLTLGASRICVESIDFHGVVIDAAGGAPLASIRLDAGRVVLVGAGVEATSLRSTGLSLGNLHVGIERGGYDPQKFRCLA
ncbi:MULTISPECIES: hypothetical protein [Protofrankia]|uniref:Uncharacterized protein n=2 Tax=Candidatus Protofrankia datiscae TaxID=2716812 RepID=F8B0M9_9ACTN|nr:MULTISPECIES: hypothetical protein [Protofrankia]AEH10661.1 hypothetical protein FsymDg_3359 [Candidatus Protofrankia datiscae]